MCISTCGSGQKQCYGNGYQTCVLGSTGCYGWSSTTNCASGQMCTTVGGCQPLTCELLYGSGYQKCGVSKSPGLQCCPPSPQKCYGGDYAAAVCCDSTKEVQGRAGNNFWCN